MSIWSNARATLGDGTPQDGADFDCSAQFRQAQSGVKSAAPGAQWTGTAADAYEEANSRQGRTFGQMAVLDQRLGAEVDRSAAMVAAGRKNLDGVKQWVLDAAASVPPSADREQMLMPIARKGIADVAEIVKQSNSELNVIGGRIRTIGDEYQALGGNKKQGPGLKEPRDEDQDPANDDDLNTITGRDDDARKRASAEAFKQVFGRPPTSAIDWETAEALNPNSYDPKYKGVKPEIRVVKIRPVPGQGVVRASQYIEQRDVISGPGTRDFGDNRTANRNFDPENARVTTYIDYENGIVVMRQNPSVQLDASGGPGEVRVRAPEGRVWQNPDGSVRIQYSAANPFAPEIAKNPMGPVNPVTVNGDLVFTPGADGLRVDGTRTDYPSLEVYQDLPTGQSHTVLIDPARSGRSWGPAANLEFHHEIGFGGMAFGPFTEWNTEFDVPGADKPSTPFGRATNPPSVPPLPVPRGTTQV